MYILPFELRSSDFNVDLFAAGIAGSFHYCADRFSDSAVSTDNHTHIVCSNAENEIDDSFVGRFILKYGNFVGVINNSAGNVA